MSNHIGGNMLNDVLRLIKRNEIFDLIGLNKSQQLILDIVKIGRDGDCNDGEMLEGIAEEFGICDFCLSTEHTFSQTACSLYREECGIE